MVQLKVLIELVRHQDYDFLHDPVEKQDGWLIPLNQRYRGTESDSRVEDWTQRLRRIVEHDDVSRAEETGKGFRLYTSPEPSQKQARGEAA